MKIVPDPKMDDSRLLVNGSRKPKVGDKVKLVKDWDAWPDSIEGIIDNVSQDGTRISIEGSAFLFRVDKSMPTPKFKIEFIDEKEEQYYT